ncbi:MAG: hypothetical protein ABA06_01615 [Parcubacteria bacterium C7867-001]|nr:MAG: hypothetical protein ABA06_01615 [Parcubacteria bacterium C7867-001]
MKTSSNTQLMKVESKKRNPFFWGVLGFIVGIGAAGIWLLGNYIPEFSLPDTDSTASTTMTPDGELPPASNLISVEDQNAGTEVIVQKLDVPSPGVWAAVQERNGGKLGNVLGAARVTAPDTGVAIPLLRATEPAHSYAVVLYRNDNGGDFAFDKNSVYVDYDTGDRVVAPFSTK